MENTRKILAGLRPSVAGRELAARASSLEALWPGDRHDLSPSLGAGGGARGALLWGLIGLICFLGITILGILTGAFECGMGPWSKHFC